MIVTPGMKPLEIATAYFEQGWQPTPVLYKDKKAYMDGWPNRRYSTAEDLRSDFNGKPQNVGVLLGEPSNWLTDLDLDCPEAVRIAYRLLPKTLTFGRDGNPRSHLLFYAPGCTSYKWEYIGKGLDGKRNKSCLLELRSTGLQSRFPGSFTKENEVVRFENDLTPRDIDPQRLVYLCNLIASAALIAQHWPGEGSRNKAAMALSGALLRSNWSREQVKLFVHLVADAAGDEESENRVGTVDPSADKLATRKDDVSGWPSLAKLIGDEPVNTVMRWLDIADVEDGFRSRQEPQQRNSPSTPSQAQALVELASEVVLFHNPDGEAYALIPVRDHTETWHLSSKSFKQWLSKRFYDRERKPPSAQAVQEALSVLEGQAMFEGPEIPVHVRLAEYNKAFYLDLGNENWEVVEVTADGWKIINDPPVRFRRPSGMKPLPHPLRGGTLDELRPFINAQDENTWVLMMSWLVAAMRPQGPYPILLIQGEQGSAKSTTSRYVASMVDPKETLLETMPGNERDLMIFADGGWVLGFDNLSGISPASSDALCRLSTGAGFSTRSLYSNREREVFKACRPMILNGIDDIAHRDDLAQRSLVLNLPPIKDGTYKSEKRLNAEFLMAYPRILGALLDAVSTGIRNLPNVRLETLPRMADFAEWVTACEPALPWAPGTFMSVYDQNRQDSIMSGLEADPVSSTLLSFMEQRDEWNGTATELLRALCKVASADVQRSRAWPKDAKNLSKALKRSAPKLRKAIGLDIRSERSNDVKRSRIVRITREKQRP